MFTPEQTAALRAPLARDQVRERNQAGRRLSYVEGWFVIAEANRIFGFDGWQSETVDIRCVAEGPRKIGRPPNTRDGHGVSYVARVKITVDGIVREGVGSGHGIDADLGLAHESAIKEAETDARKRALMTFGNPFGLALYDKEQRHVADEPQPQPQPGNPIDLAEIVAYQSRAKTDLANIDSKFGVVEWWKSEGPRRAALGITKDTKAYADLVKLCEARNDAILDEVGGKYLAAGL